LCRDTAAVYVRGRGWRRTLWYLLIVDQFLNKIAVWKPRRRRRTTTTTTNSKFLSA
jgi:hypothetical protein